MPALRYFLLFSDGHRCCMLCTRCNGSNMYKLQSVLFCRRGAKSSSKQLTVPELGNRLTRVVVRVLLGCPFQHQHWRWDAQICVCVLPINSGSFFRKREPLSTFFHELQLHTITHIYFKALVHIRYLQANRIHVSANLFSESVLEWTVKCSDSN